MILPWDRLHRPTVRLADTNREELHRWYEQWTTNVGTIYSQDRNTKVKQTVLVDEEGIDSLKCERLQPALHESDLVLVVMNLTAKKYITFSLSFVLKIPKNISSTLMQESTEEVNCLSDYPKYSPECTQNIFRDFEYKSLDNQTLQFQCGEGQVVAE